MPLSRTAPPTESVVNLSSYPGWDSAVSATQTAAMDAAAVDAWGGTYIRYLDIPHHPTQSEYVRSSPWTYVEGMAMRGLGTSREFNGPSDIQIRYAGGSQFVAWPNAVIRRCRFEDLLFSGNQILDTTSQWFVASGAMVLEDVDFVNCSWKFYQTVIDAPVLRVTLVGEAQYINNGNARQLYLRGSDVKIRGNLFLGSQGMRNDTWLATFTLSMSEIDRIYASPAGSMGIQFKDGNSGLKARAVVNGLGEIAARIGYATTASFPTASTVPGMLFKADNDIKTYRSNGTTYDVFWDGVTPTQVTVFPGSPTLGQMVEDTNGEPGIRFYRWDGTRWVGPKYHTDTTSPKRAQYDGADGPLVTFEDGAGSMDLDAYLANGGYRVVSGFRQGMAQVLNCRDEISMRLDLSYIPPDAGYFTYDLRDTNLPAGQSVRARIADNLGRSHLAGRVEAPRIFTSGDVRVDYLRTTAQIRAHRPVTWETTAGATLSSGAVVQSTLYLGAFETARRITAARFEVTAAVTSAVARIAIYYDDNNGWPGALAYASTSTAAATTGVKSPSVEPDLPPGRYWIGLVGQTAAGNFRTFTGVVDGIPQIAAGGVNMSALSIPTVTAAPPDPFPAVGGSPLPANAALLPIVWLQAT